MTVREKQMAIVRRLMTALEQELPAFKSPRRFTPGEQRQQTWEGLAALAHMHEMMLVVAEDQGGGLSPADIESARADGARQANEVARVIRSLDTASPRALETDGGAIPPEVLKAAANGDDVFVIVIGGDDDVDPRKVH